MTNGRNRSFFVSVDVSLHVFLFMVFLAPEVTSGDVGLLFLPIYIDVSFLVLVLIFNDQR